MAVSCLISASRSAAVAVSSSTVFKASCAWPSEISRRPTRSVRSSRAGRFLGRVFLPMLLTPLIINAAARADFGHDDFRRRFLEDHPEIFNPQPLAAAAFQHLHVGGEGGRVRA